MLPQKYLTDPQPRHTFVYVCTLQRMSMHLLGPQLGGGGGDENLEADAERIDIPIHAFDVVIADECHRGGSAEAIARWRATLDHFDAIRIGLTAAPAPHTASYFTHQVFTQGGALGT